MSSFREAYERQQAQLAAEAAADRAAPKVCRCQEKRKCDRFCRCSHRCDWCSTEHMRQSERRFEQQCEDALFHRADYYYFEE